MDIPPLPRQLLAQLKPLLSAQNIDEALAPGKRLSAVVEKVSEVTPELRARLLSLFVESKNADGKGAVKPAPLPPTLSQTLAKETLARQTLTAQTPTVTAKATDLANTNNLQNAASTQSTDTNTTLNQLLASKLLQLVEVKVLNRNLLLLTQVALSPNTKLAFQVRPDGQLQLVNTNTSGAQKAGAANATSFTASPSPSTAASQSASQQRAQFGAALPPTTDKNNAQRISQHYKAQVGITPSTEKRVNVPTPLNTEASKSQALHQAVKTYLPLQQNLANSLNQLEKLIGASNNANLEKQLPKLAPILNQVNTLVAQIPQFKQLTQSQQLQTVMEKSGFFLEGNLRQLSQSPSKPATILNTTAKNSGPDKPATPPSTDKQFDDFKASILKLVNDLNQILTPSNTNPTQKSSQSLDSLIRSIFSFTKEAKSKSDQQSQQQLTATVARHLHTTLFSAIARITHLQVQQLLQQDSGQSANGFNIELPVRFGEQLVPLSLSVHEKMYDDRKERSEEEKKKDNKRDIQKRWHVFMEFDLDEYGAFASEITVQQGSVSTTLWVQQHDLWQTTNDHILDLKQELENNGVEVEAITLHRGKAPEKPLQLNQSLVDIRT